MSQHKAPPDGAAITLAALGVVFGDIGTSPLYTFQECVTGDHGVPPTPENVLGVLSLIFWALFMVVTVKYLAFLMRADNQGEGGIMALLALVPERLRAVDKGRLGAVSLLVILGAALLFGDGIVTPAISVLSALEGVAVATPALQSAIVPATCVILFGLFAIQRRGTGSLGVLFGPVMLAWFLAIGALGAYRLIAHPQVLAALSPVHAAHFLLHHGGHGFRLLGSVVLAVTGGEALYADMGHFGRKPIQRAWYLAVWPGLLLCYFGQGALVLATPSLASQPFYSLVPAAAGRVGVFALVGLATLATIIASQALISGVFSLTQQAMRLGFFPRVTVRHTSEEAEGQIYVPLLNWGLMLCCVALVLALQKSSRLAAAYGLAVSGTMGITSVIYSIVCRTHFGWPRWKVGGLLVLFLAFDIPFLLACLLKFFDGGFIPVVAALLLALMMGIWRIGRSHLQTRIAAASSSEADFLSALRSPDIARVPGTVVVMAASAQGIPPVLQRLVRRLRVLHRDVILLTVQGVHQPHLSDADGPRATATRLDAGLSRVVLRYGFMERFDIPAALQQALRELGLNEPPSAPLRAIDEPSSAPLRAIDGPPSAPLRAIDAKPQELVYLMGHETFAAAAGGEMGEVTEGIFAFLSRNARNATDHFGIPPEQVVELGARFDL